MKIKNKNHGFTIVELLIVIVVIAILATISIIGFNGVQARARDAERKSDIANIVKVVEVYYIDNGKYPRYQDMMNPTWRSANFITKDQSIFINPQDKNSINSMNASGGSVTIDKYSYYETPIGAGTGYNIVYKLENKPNENVIVKGGI